MNPFENDLLSASDIGVPEIFMCAKEGVLHLRHPSWHPIV